MTRILSMLREVLAPARARYRRRKRRPSPRILLAGGLALLLGWLVVAPLALVVWGSFQSGPPGTTTSFTISNYLRAYGHYRIFNIAKNTVVFALGSALFSLVVGTYLAWVTERTDFPLRRVVYVIALLPMVVPGILRTIAWVLLLDPQIGILNHLANHLIPGLGGPIFSSNGMLPMIWVDGLDGTHISFLLMLAAFRSVDPSFEEASAISGAGSARTMFRVVLPILSPAVLAAFLLLFLRAIETLEVPLLMGLPAGVNVFSTEVYLSTEQVPVDTNLAAAFGLVYILIAVGALLMYGRATRLSERFATISGKGFRPRRVRLGRRKWWHLAIVTTILLVGEILPYLVMVYTSLLPRYIPPGAKVLGAFGLGQYRQLLHSPAVLDAFRTTLEIGACSAGAAVVLSLLVTFVTLRTRVRGRRVLDMLTTLPIAIPGAALGLAMLWLYLAVPLPVYGTMWLLVIGLIAKFSPYGVRMTHAGALQVGAELEEASAVAGASAARTSLKVTIPLITGSVLIAFIYIFSSAFKILSLPLLLSGNNNVVLPLLMFQLYSNGEFALLNALGVLVVLMLLVVSLTAMLIAGRFGHTKTEGQLAVRQVVP